MDSAVMIADKGSVGMKLGMTISEFGNLTFSKTGKRLFFGTAAIQPPKDTTLVDIDLVKVSAFFAFAKILYCTGPFSAITFLESTAGCNATIELFLFTSLNALK